MKQSSKAARGEIASPRERYFEARGGRKTATAVARIFPGKKGITVNTKEYTAYFREGADQEKVRQPLEALEQFDKLGVSVRVAGSGIHAQAEAVRHAIARALVKLDESFKKSLRAHGYLTRDSRMVERKKYGLKKARRAPQWSKR